MFDWNDEELATLLWGEAGENDDHIVPYPKGRKERPSVLRGDQNIKEQNQKATYAKPVEQKKPVAKAEYAGGKQECLSQHDTNDRIYEDGSSMDPWPDFSLSHASKNNQEFMGAEMSKNLDEIAKFDSSKGEETSQLDNHSKIFQNQLEEREPSDFVDYGWANIGSFDDLDRIFSNDDPIFGHASHGNGDELWSSSKDMTISPEKSSALSLDSPSLGFGALTSASSHFEANTEHVQDKDQFFTDGYAEMSHLTCHAQQSVHATADQVDYVGGKIKPVLKAKTSLELPGKVLSFNSPLAVENIRSLNEFSDKVNNHEKLLKMGTKSEEGCEGQHYPDSCSIWSPHGNQFQQLNRPIAPSTLQTCSSSVLCHKAQLLGPTSLVYQPSIHGSIKSQYTMIDLPHTQFIEDNQAVISAYEVSRANANPLSKSSGTSMKPVTMTPREKIKKLRRRQKMQALLAIQKQQHQYSHQASSNDDYVAQNCLDENQILLTQGGNIKVNGNATITLPSIDPNSPKQDDSSPNSMEIDHYYTVEDTILHHLQDTIAKLDVQVRLCIRDSLFRLAHSAIKRQDANDTSSTNETSGDEVCSEEETSSHNRLTQIRNVETESNYIDRAVAHLLFHSPLEVSGKHPETPESPASSQLPCERSTTDLLQLPRGLLPDCYKSKQKLLFYGSKTPHLFSNFSKNSPFIDTSEKASNCKGADGGGIEIEASQ